MKKLKFPLFLCLMALVAFSFSACSDDDDDNGPGKGVTIDPELLIGMWDEVSYSGWSKEDGEITETWNEENSYDSRWELKADHTVDLYSVRTGSSNNYQWEKTGTAKWKTNGSYLEVYDIVDDGYQEEDMKMQMVSQSKDKYVLGEYFKEVEDGVTYEAYEESIYERVK